MFRFLRRKGKNIASILAARADEDLAKWSLWAMADVGCEAPQEPELFYLTGAVLTTAYLLAGPNHNKGAILDEFSSAWLERLGSINDSANIVRNYQRRYADYDSLLRAALLDEIEAPGGGFVTFGMHAYECVSGASAAGSMLAITLSAPKIMELVYGDIRFVKEGLNQ